MVSFQLSEEQTLLRDTCRDFALTVMRKSDRNADESGEIPLEIIQQGHQLGLTFSYIPVAYGGAGEKVSAINSIIALEELAYGNLSMTLNITAPSLFTLPVLFFGTEEQKKKYFAMINAEKFQPFTAAIVEPLVKFDMEYLKTTAKDDGEDIVINGEKASVALGEAAIATLVFARKGSGQGFAGVDGYIVSKDGFVVKEREKNQGLRALQQASITLEGTRISKDNVLSLTGGFATLVARSRVAMTALTTGVCRAAYDYALNYSKERIAFGEPIASRQSIAFTLAEMAIEIDAMRLMAWKAAWMLDKGMDAYKEAAIAKRYSADAAMFITRNAVQILGGHGFIREHPVEMWYRDARVFAATEFLAII